MALVCTLRMSSYRQQKHVQSDDLHNCGPAMAAWHVTDWHYKHGKHRVTLTSTLRLLRMTRSASCRPVTSTGSSHLTEPWVLCCTVKLATCLKAAGPPSLSIIASCVWLGMTVYSVPSRLGSSSFTCICEALMCICNKAFLSQCKDFEQCYTTESLSKHHCQRCLAWFGGVFSAVKAGQKLLDL